MKRPLAALLVLVASGCTFLRSSKPALVSQSLTQGGNACVIVLLPGLGDAPSHFSQHHFEGALGADAGCDLEVVDSHFGYYRDGVIAQRLGERLVELDRRYARVWLAGVSLGGYGAALTAQAYPHLVDGVILISPFLGVPRSVRPLVARIEREGGLEAFFDDSAHEPGNPKKHFMRVEPLWQWLAERARDEGGPRLVLAFGEDDGFAWKHRVVGAALDQRDVIHLPGGHDWTTFSGLWREVAAAAPWKG